MQTICMIEFTFQGDKEYVMSVIKELKKIAKDEDTNHKEMALLFNNYYFEDEELDEMYKSLREAKYYYDSGGCDSSFSPKDVEGDFEGFSRRFIEDFVNTFPSCELTGEFSQFTTVCDITEFRYSFYSSRENKEYSIKWIEEEELGSEME